MQIDKELIDQHTKEIEELRNRPQVQMSGDGGMDMNEMMKLFACKSPPDNTINRIQALEDKMADQNGKFDDLLRRVQGLETRADKSDNRLDGCDNTLDDHERRIKMLESMETGAVTGDVDTAAILKIVNQVKAELSMVRSDLSSFSLKTTQDLEALRLELRGYTDKETGDLKRILMKKIDDVSEQLKFEHERLRAEFETFKNKEHRDLEARVSALEKKFLKLQEAFANLRIPESSGGGVSQEAFNALE